MSTRSIRPRISCSLPIGISVATTWGPKAVLSDSRARKKSARSRSSMFTKIRRATPSSAARVHSRWVETSTPITPLTTNTADSHTRSAPSASAMNDGSPGVSIRLTFTSRQANDASAAEIDIPRACSSWSESDTVVPSATVPSRVVAPASNSRASCSDVFPLPRWPTRATLRILSAACGMPGAPLLRAAPSTRPWKRGGYRQSRRLSPWSLDFRRRTAFVCSWEMRDSVTPRTSPISRRVRFS